MVPYPQRTDHLKAYFVSLELCFALETIENQNIAIK